MLATRSVLERVKHYNFENKRDTLIFLLRGFICLGALITGAINANTGFGLQATMVDCIEDYVLDATVDFNEYFADTKEFRYPIMIFSSLCFDILLVSFAIRWTCLGKTWQPIICIFFFYAARGLLQVVCI